MQAGRVPSDRITAILSGARMAGTLVHFLTLSNPNIARADRPLLVTAAEACN